tara:strand:+ start:103696 stop:104079 length:384 start_codon:yes stop_codon:yes gene_type:complete
MKKMFGKKMIASLLTVSLLGSSVASVSYAGMIGTNSLVAASQANDSRARVSDVLSRDNVRDQMIAMGVDPVEVQGRIAALTDEELRMLDSRLESLPAGSGILGLIGAVFVVLLILEVTGVIDIFKRS